MIAGPVDLMFESLQSIAPIAHAGNVRALAVSGVKRSPAFLDLPTIAEAGVPGYAASTWTGVIAPAGVPRGIVESSMQRSTRRSHRKPSRKNFAKTGDEPGGGTPEEFAATIERESAKWADVIKRAGIEF